MPLEQTKSLYKRTLTEIVFVRRYTGTGANRTSTDTLTHARVFGDRPAQLVGTNAQYDQTAIVLAQDLTDAGFAHPITTGDRLIVKGVERAIMFPDNATRTDGGELVAYVLNIRG